FAFDATGNFANYKQDSNGDGTFDLNQNRVHNKVNEITSIADSTSYVACDKNGNMTKVPKSDNWSAAYDLVYDAWNRLITVKSGSTVIASYAYDALNRRVKKVVGSETRLFYFNRQWQCVEKYVGSTCNVRFVWGLRYVDDLVTYRKDSTDYYVLQDANWNVVALTNASGVVQERYTYMSFGKLNVFDASFVPKSASIFNLTRLFTGQVLDNETGLMLYRNRVYHPMLGRFLQRDPIGYGVGDVNLMRYVKNSAIELYDPDGMRFVGPTCSVCLGAYMVCQRKAAARFAICASGLLTGAGLLELGGCTGACRYLGYTAWGAAACVTACTAGALAIAGYCTIPHCQLGQQQDEMACGRQYNQCAFQENASECCCGPGNENWRPD
ncbi:MAG: RHS repeat-associated core domain-containing protein, partial [Planctomycetaceae bacterium]|nr:RHS repeat-associated core domain-containing protein [Planctomycetaceae bacterium]